jgi:phage shock protein C
MPASEVHRPVGDEAEPLRARPRLTRSREDRIIGGVAGGLGRYFAIDPVIVRVAFVVLAFTGGGILAYLIAWIVIPEAGDDETGPARATAASSMVAGLVLIALGGILLVDRIVPVFSWRYVGPVLLIGLGVLLLARREGSR